ncbi:MAG: outer membrane beta-barrel protein [Bacteroidales bacterium]|nr:outer membrane beta-barrel protein [Bacteroidales bacterium]
MKRVLLAAVAAVCFLIAGIPAAAQSHHVVTATLVEESTGDPVPFATVSLTPKGSTKVYKYVLSGEDGRVKFEGVKKGQYTFKAELMGYKPISTELEIKDVLDLGTLKMADDKEVLDAANVSAVGNPIVIKKDTVEYNATSFKTTDNDVLEDLLKKLPGVEVDESGTVTVNGQEIKKITIEGKTFFLDDPSLATKNLPAKIINKVKVVNKKSEQAEFTGIDDGEEETILDLNIKPGMMKGMFGNFSLGGGHDVPASKSSSVGEVPNDYRYQAAGFMGNFTDKQQLSLVINANNTNNRGFNDLSGSMMQGMRGGGGGMGRGRGGWGGGNGITTSYMIGGNGAWTLFDDKMDLGGNYLYNHTSRDVAEKSYKETYYDDRTLLSDNEGSSNTTSSGHRIGVRLEHKFSENTSILFEPRLNFGTGSFWEKSDYATRIRDAASGVTSDTNDGNSFNNGSNKNISTSGFFLFRQRLGKPGRTMTVMTRYSLSNNDLVGANQSLTNTYDGGEVAKEVIDQSYTSNQKSYSLMGRVTYTEPIAEHFFAEVNYGYNWNKSTSNKETLDLTRGGVVDYTYSNSIINLSRRHDMGANLVYQKEGLNAQIGFAAIPTYTYNSTTKWDATRQAYEPKVYENPTWNWSPRARIFWEINDNANLRTFYWGNSNQPSTSQLMPVPDITNPLNISFGNPDLKPYFSHSIRGEFRYNNKKTFFTANINYEGGFVQDPIVNATWSSKTGTQYSMPFNGPTSGNAGLNGYLNIPIGQSGFTVMNFARTGWSHSSNYVGSNIDMSGMPDPTVDYYDFMEQFLAKYKDIAKSSDFGLNTINNLNVVERLRLTYRNDAIEVSTSGRTRVSRSWYTIVTGNDLTTTWNNQVNAALTWTWDLAGLTLKSDFNYNWYRGYTTAQPSEYIWNAEIQKLLFKKKFTLAVKGYDILGQSKNLMVTDASNYHSEVLNNTLGRYIIVSLTWRFGTMNREGMRGPGGPGGRGFGGPPMGGQPMGGRGPR